MENPYNNEQPYQPVPPQEPIPPTPSLYQGNNGFATASLVMGILSLVCIFSTGGITVTKKEQA